jgi:N-acetylglucosamine-6-phosphate deacetylase
VSGGEILALVGARIHTGRVVLDRHAVLVRDGRIEDVVPATALPPDVATRSCAGCVLAPGFIDLQVNGGGDVLFGAEPTVAALDRIAAAHARFGTTRFLPTLITGPRAAMAAACDAVRAARAAPSSGVLGLHFEGPFLNPAKRGVHDAGHMRVPDAADLALLTAAGGGVTLLTLAPEQVPPGFIARLVAAGVRVAAGHSDAAPNVLRRALAEGLSLFTHLYNAMGQMRAREPGVVGVALADTAAWCSIIADGHHVHDAALAVAWRAKAAGKLLLVSDAMPPVGGTVPRFVLDGRTIAMRDGRCVTADGVLAGSAIGLSAAVHHCVRQVGVPLDEALRMASTYVAEFLGRDDIGRIVPGARADLVALDAALDVAAAWRDGRLVYDAGQP